MARGYRRGVDIPPVGRRSSDPRPGIEVIAPDGSDIDASAVQRVAVGRPSGPPGSRLVLAVAVVVTIVAIGLSGDDGDPESVTAPRPPPGTSPIEEPPSTAGLPDATLAPVAPLPGAAGEDGGALLLYGGGRWTIVQLATGARRLAALPADETFDGVVVEGGVVVTDHTTGGLYYDLGQGATHATFADRPHAKAVRLGPAEAVLPADRPDQVWLVHRRDTPRAPLPDGVTSATLVDLHGNVLRRIEVKDLDVLDASEAGLTVAQGGRVLVADERGTRELAEGEVRAARHGMVVVETCGRPLTCRLELLDVVSGDRHALAEGSSPRRVDLVRAADGRLAVTVVGTVGSTVTLFGAEGERRATLPVLGLRAVPQWLPGDLGLLLTSSSVQRLTVPSGRPEAAALLGLDDLSADVALVIPG